MSDFDAEKYFPEPMRRYPVDLEPAGEAVFDNLDGAAKDDIVECLGRKFDIRVTHSQLKGKEIPVYLVDPTVLIGDSGRDVTPDAVEKYGELLSDDPSSMPPVIIDTDEREYPLMEGGHRTVGAIRAGVPKIYAIDVATAYILGNEIGFRKATSKS